VICPLLLIVLEGAIFTYLLYSKDIMLYGAKGTDRTKETFSDIYLNCIMLLV
jgi:hypothetical protein